MATIRQFTAIYIVIALSLFFGWQWMFVENEWLRALGINLLQAAVGGVSFLGLFKAYQKITTKQRYFWLLLSIGVLSYVFAKLFWFYRLLTIGSVFISNRALLIFLLAYLFFLLALIYKVKVITTNIVNGTALFNIVIFIISFASIFSYYLIRPVYERINESIIHTIIIAYPVLDLTILFVALYLYYFSLETKEAPVYRLLIASFFIQIIADSMFTFQFFTNGYQPGLFVDFLWLIALLIIGLSGFYVQHLPEQKLTKRGTIGVLDELIPYINVLVLLVLCIQNVGWRLTELGISLVAVIVMIIFRQLWLLRKNAKLMAEYKHLAFHDPLTGLKNRASFQAELPEILNEAKWKTDIAALLLIDLDRFKKINDTHGHSIGDSMLINASKRLQQTLQLTGELYRIGGDEFVMVLPKTTEEECELIAKKLLQAFAAPFVINHHELTITPSIGISLYPESGEDFETLLKNADRAMYFVKERGKNHYHFFDCELAVIQNRKMKLETGLRKAIEKNELEIYYQPKMELKSIKIVGMEALLRWNHSTLGFISPAEFIPIAEETGQIVSIGEWVLKQACQQNKQWQDEGIPALCVSVNVSVVQLQYSNLVTTVKQALEETGLEPHYLELEITESLMQNIEESTEVLKQLKNLGVKTAIDDFGMGYSSLHVLKKLPIDTIKIDKSFIDDIEDELTQSIIKTIIEIGINLNLDVVAEGIEREEQVLSLAKYSRIIGQGYLFSKPTNSEDFTKILKNEM
ncbi:EAL domain-containing protein [Bacillus sp. B15-48]|uniref:putative bifunctional diguanylate cyclase/phosphodiesterase n=1 Tax=Bacillus sp. B15-48 TaxID=1548601 RepID=UPI00193F17F2|nr:EAL domain-containing protein [Bacillus sp. B15-48]MBM4760976.1 EAL domain-containing protein [Bacillus sp. B15-48]